ncbi:MAG TPA: hypothetical protein VFE89_14450, partial [Beijerinckiaceae bacterium]|nr:hypothetical protein [Beijerinckiaceae bacterium]
MKAGSESTASNSHLGRGLGTDPVQPRLRHRQSARDSQVKVLTSSEAVRDKSRSQPRTVGGFAASVDSPFV